MFDEKSKPRATVYGALVGTAMMFAYYLDWSDVELNLWITYIGLILPAFGLGVAAVRTWPKHDVSSEPTVNADTFLRLAEGMGAPDVSGETVPASCATMHGTAEPHVLGCEGWHNEGWRNAIP